MNANNKIHQARLNDWANKIAEQTASGLTAREWCAQNNLSIHKYNYWKHLLKEVVVDQPLPDIAPLPVPSSINPTIPTSIHNAIPYADSTNRTNCANRANCTTFASTRITIGDISIEVDPTLPTELLCSLIKAVRYA